MNDGITIKLSIFFRKNHIYCISSAKFSVCGQIRLIKFFSGFSISIFMLCWAKWPQTIDWDLFWFFHVNFITLLSQKKFIWVPNGQMRSIEIFSEFFIWILSFFWVKKKLFQCQMAKCDWLRTFLIFSCQFYCSAAPNGQIRSALLFSDFLRSIWALCGVRKYSFQRQMAKNNRFSFFWIFVKSISMLFVAEPGKNSIHLQKTKYENGFIGFAPTIYILLCKLLSLSLSRWTA